MTKFATESAVTAELLAKYEPVIGLEVHVQLLTRSKIFCGCSTRFGDPPNSNVCPVCLGLPGTLPVLNQRAVEMGMRAALALNCTVHEHSRFARKNYFRSQCLPGVSRLARHAAGFEPTRRRNGYARCSRLELHRSRAFAFRSKKLFQISMFARCVSACPARCRF